MTISLRAAVLAAVLCALVPAAAGARQTHAFPCADPHAVTALAEGPAGALLAGTMGEGLYRTAAGGVCWTPIVRFPANAEVGILLVPPGHPDTIIAASSLAASPGWQGLGPYRSDDGGRTWTDGAAGLPRGPVADAAAHLPRAPLPVALAASPRTGTLVLSYICMHDAAYPSAHPLCPRGLARSADGGRTWQPAGPPAQTDGVVALADGTFLALQPPPLGLDQDQMPGTIYRSRDDGRTWQAFATMATATGPLFYLEGIASFYAVPWDARRVFIGADDLTHKAFAYRSTDGGAHWSPPRVRFPGPTTGKAPPAMVDRYVDAFAGLRGTHTLLLSDVGRIYRSTDGGTTWRPSSAGLPDPAAVWTLLAPGDGATVYAGTGDGIYHSSDDGRTWHT